MIMPRKLKFPRPGPHATKLVFAGGLLALATFVAPSALFAAPLAVKFGEVVEGIPGEMFAGLTEAGAEGLCNKWFTGKGALNHNIQISLQRAFRYAIQELQAKYMIYFPYEEALSILLFKMSDQHPQYKEVQEYQKQIQETIQKWFQNPGTPLGELEDKVKVEHKEVLAELNEITRRVLGFSFEDLCKKLKPANRVYLCAVRHEKLSLGYIDPPTLDGEKDVHKYIRFKTYQAYIDMSRLYEIFTNQASNVNISDPKNVYETIRSKEKVNEKINEDLSYALKEINPFLADIVQKHMADYWKFYFAEELKNPDDQGTRAWRAFERLYQEAMLDSIQGVKSDIQNISQQLSKQGEQLSEQLSKQLSEQRDKLSKMHDMTNVLIEKSSLVIDEANISHKALQEERITQEWTDEIKSMLNTTIRTLPSSQDIKEATRDIKESAGDIKESAGDIKESAGIIQKNIARATEILGETEQKLQKSIDRLDDAIDRIEGVADRLEKFLKDVRNFIQGHFLYILFVIVLLFGLIGFVVFAIHPDNYSLWLLGITCLIWGLLVLLLAYPLWNAHPWKVDGMEPGLWTILGFPFLFVLIGFPAFAGERILEPFKSPMPDDSVNVVISNFISPFGAQVEGHGIANAIERNLVSQLFVKADVSQQDVRLYHPHMPIHSEEEARAIATQLNANIVIWGERISMGRYDSVFFVRDPIEGGLEMATSLYVLPHEFVETGTSNQAEIIIFFVKGLIHLFSDDEAQLESAIKDFESALEVIEETNEGRGGGERDSVEDILYFFKGRALAAAGRHEEALAAYTQAIEINEQYSWAHIGRGNVYFDQALQENPSNLELMGQALGEYTVALHIHEGVVRDTPAPIAYIKAKSYVNIGNIYSIFAEESTDDGEFANFVQLSKDAYEKALVEYEQAALDTQSDVAGRYPAKAHYGLGVVYTLEGEKMTDQDKYDQAIQQFDLCLEQTPSDPAEDPRATGIRQLCEEEKSKVLSQSKVWYQLPYLAYVSY